MKVEHGTFDISRMTPKEIQQVSYQNWLDDGHYDGEILIKWDHILPIDGATVIDMGGYDGKWSDKMMTKYPTIIKQLIIYEPVPDYYVKIKERFTKDHRVKMHNKAAWIDDNPRELFVQEAGSSANVRKGDASGSIKIECVACGEHIKSHFPIWKYMPKVRIDLLKINIEGDEFGVIQELYQTDVLKHINAILVQTHPFGENPVEDYELLYGTLIQTHERVWNYPWIWEYWRLK